MISKLLGTEPPKGSKQNSIFQMPELDSDDE